MEFNYHTHTYRCGHADGTPEEYVKTAIEGGIKYMGFSDHIPLRFTDGTESDFRVPTNEGKIYCDEIKALAEKYRDKIDIRVGFEAEYYPAYFGLMLEKAIEYGAEYLILGQHFLGPDNLSTTHTIKGTHSVEKLREYVETVISAMKTRKFTYVAHPDIFKFTGDSEIYREEMRKLCAFSRELNVPLEINFLGIRDGRNYPNDDFWCVAGEEKSPVTFGCDAHNAPSAYDADSVVRAKELVCKYKLNYIGKPDLVLLNNKKQ